MYSLTNKYPETDIKKNVSDFLRNWPSSSGYKFQLFQLLYDYHKVSDDSDIINKMAGEDDHKGGIFNSIRW